MNCRGMHPPKETFWTIPSWIQPNLLAANFAWHFQGTTVALPAVSKVKHRNRTSALLAAKLCFKCFAHILGMYCGLSTSMLFDGLFIHVCLLDAFFQLCLCLLLSCSYLVLLAATVFTVERYARVHVDVHMHKLLHILYDHMWYMHAGAHQKQLTRLST